MAYCNKCGKPLAEGAAFCSFCGTAVSDESAQRKQVFVGSIRKCPNCGEQIGSDTTKCPSCGFVIEKKTVSSALDVFIKKFLSLKNSSEKREYIEGYAIANNKEDIRDFLNYAASQRDKAYMDNQTKAFWVDAWNNKCRQIVNQAFDTFGADVDFSAWLKNYKQDVEKTTAENEKLKKKLISIEKGKKRAKVAKVFLKWFGIIVLALALLFGAGYGIRSCSIKAAEYSKIRAEKKLEMQKLKAQQEKEEQERAERQRQEEEARKQAEVKAKQKQAIQKAAERQKLINGCVIPKENIQLAGFLPNHFIPISDCTITLNSKNLHIFLNGDGEIIHSIYFKIKATDDVSDFIKKTVEEKRNSIRKEFDPAIYRYETTQPYEYGTKIETNYGEINEPSFRTPIEDSLISQIIDAKKGDVITIAFDAKSRSYAKKQEQMNEELIRLHSSGIFRFQANFSYEVSFIEKEHGSSTRRLINF